MKKELLKSSLLLFLLLTACNGNLTDEELNQKYLKSVEKKEWSSSIKYLDEIIDRHPEMANAYFARALSKTNLKDDKNIDSILDDLDKSIELDSTNYKAFFLRFQAKMLALDFESSLKDIDRLILLKGEIPLLLSWKGNCAFAAKEFDIAEESYQKRLEMPGQYEDLRNNYYYLIFSKYFGGNKEGAIWDCAFLAERGFEENYELIKIMEEDKLIWEELASFTIPHITMEQLEDQFKIKGITP